MRNVWKFERNIGRFTISGSQRTSEGWGRFGGGWNWKIGIQASSPSKWGWTIILSLLVCEITFNWKTRFCIADDERRAKECAEKKLERSGIFDPNIPF